MNLFDRFHSVIKKNIIVALCALCVLFVACAEVEYGYDEIGDESIDIIEIVDRDDNIAHKDSTKSSPKPSPKATKATKSTKHTNRTNDSKDSKDLGAITMKDSKNTKGESKIPQTTLDSENKSQNHKNTFESQAIQPPNSLDSINPQDSRILNKSTTRAKSVFDASKLNLPISQLKAECDALNLQKCEDLGRIYAIQEKRNLATAHYQKACNYGKGRVMSCFFLSLIYANSGDDATASEYLNVANVDALNAQIIDEAELLLSIGEIALIKEKLKDSCANGESASCRILLSVFKIRSEMGEARAFFSAECKRTKLHNATPCAILEGALKSVL